MAFPPLIFAAMPPLAARRRPAQLALLSVLKCREEPAKCPLLGTLHDMRVSANAALRQKRPVEPACNLAELDEATSDLPFLTRLAQANSKGFIAKRSS
jgi:hypothetical protein